jgi:transposase
MKTAVIGADAEAGHIIYNRTLLDFARHYSFLPKACRPYRAKTKGKVERPFRYVREDFFLGGQFRDLEDLNDLAKQNAEVMAWVDRAKTMLRGRQLSPPYREG